MSQRSDAALGALRDAWERETQHVRAQIAAQQSTMTPAERVASGLSLGDLEVTEVAAAAGDRLKLWVQLRADAASLASFKGRIGSPVRLWVGAPTHQTTSVAGTLGPVRAHTMCVYLDQDELPAWVESPGFSLDLDAPSHLFDQGLRAITSWQTPPKDKLHLREILLGGEAPSPADKIPALTLLDAHLHLDQQEAVHKALASEDLFLIHGPPGTGKTRTLVEIVRQHVQRHQRVLVVAASNLAVDNLADRLTPHIGRLVRLGHPARVLPAVHAVTLDAQVEGKPQYTLAKSWMDQAHTLGRQLQNHRERGRSGADWRAMRQEIKGLWRDARDQLRALEASVMDRAQVVCATGSGAMHKMLWGQAFDLVVIDEASQMMDPVALGAIWKGEKVVCAGDPYQLAPTVIGDEGGRLSSTFLDRLLAAHPESTVMLTVQHRMHQDLMRFPNEQTYGGKLIAHQSVAHHGVGDLGASPDPLRPGALVLIDTAGKGWEEEAAEGGESLRNPGQAQRTAAEVRRVLCRGVRPEDVGVLTPYAGQVQQLVGLLGEECEAGVEVRTVDGFQGREKEVVVLDLVRSNVGGEIGFLGDLRRINVALTRAKRQLIVVADSATIGGHGYYGALLDAVGAWGSWVSAWSDEAEAFTG